MKKYKDSRSIGFTNKNCPTCGFHLSCKERIEVTQKQLSAPFYYERWYYCYNKLCKSKSWMFEEDKVYNKPTSPYEKENQERLNFLSSI